MRQNLMSVSSNDNKLLSCTLQPPEPSVESEKRSLDADSNELVLCPAPATVLLRRPLSLGFGQQRISKSSPRLSAVTQAFRARFNSFEERPNESRCHDRKGRRKTTTPVLSPSTMRKWEVRNFTPATEIELHSSDESVISTATTVTTCHRRVTSSVCPF